MIRLDAPSNAGQRLVPDRLPTLLCNQSTAQINNDSQLAHWSCMHKYQWNPCVFPPRDFSSQDSMPIILHGAIYAVQAGSRDLGSRLRFYLRCFRPLVLVVSGSSRQLQGVQECKVRSLPCQTDYL
eukprot:5589716-Amphidinium_carterae.1